MTPWQTLAATLKLRRNLEAALFPADQIGTLASPRAGESQESFATRLRERRAAHAAWARDLKEMHGRTDTAVLAKINKLKAKEAALWAKCRPDLYAV